MSLETSRLPSAMLVNLVPTLTFPPDYSKPSSQLPLCSSEASRSPAAEH